MYLVVSRHCVYPLFHQFQISQRSEGSAWGSSTWKLCAYCFSVGFTKFHSISSPMYDACVLYVYYTAYHWISPSPHVLEMAFKLFAVYCISIVFGGIVINKVHSNTLGLAVVWGRAGGVSRVRKKGWVRPCSGWALSSSPSPSSPPWPKYDPNDQRRWVPATRKLNKIAGTVPSPTTLHLSSLLASGYMFAHHVSKF